MRIVQNIADDTLAFEALSDDESIKLTHNALELISNFEKGSETTATELGRACCLLLTVIQDFMNVQYWQTVEELYSGVNHEFYREEITAVRNYYLECILEQPLPLHKQR
ncbi:hypothetical protein MXM41_09665 [Leclercia adecarboxylata]|uniref:hypothetical protein n=1 Tax=Leclercia adecarboxylata TaxID=83655 RepID=UPI002DB64C6D|nr:hypothetical protein [Leclercia adecarboxylata]MEB6379198.1 hypothetical protein [Leclercia adecarboxylata]